MRRRTAPSDTRARAEHRAVTYQQAVSYEVPEMTPFVALNNFDPQNMKVAHFSSLSVPTMCVRKLQFCAISFKAVQRCSLVSSFHHDGVSRGTGNSTGVQPLLALIEALVCRELTFTLSRQLAQIRKTDHLGI